VADVAAEELNWSEARKKTEIDAVTKVLKLPR
jgi:hypothetical protein